MKLKTIILISLFMLSSVASADTFDIVRPNEDYQDCVSLTVKYCDENPEYIPCSISRFPTFEFSHMVAIKIIDGETIEMHDSMYDAHFTIYNFIIDGEVMWDDWGTYYHFWIDEPVLRNWGVGRVLDNTGIINDA